MAIIEANQELTVEQPQRPAVGDQGKSGTEAARLPGLDAIRGLAAIVVIFFHVVVAFFPLVLDGASPRGAVERVLQFPFIRWAYNGGGAVELFFVLSGFVLSVPYFQSRRASLVTSGAIRRYLRLGIPSCASIFLAYAVLSAGLSYSGRAAATRGPLGSTHDQWIYQLSFQPSLKLAIREGLVRAVLSGDCAYNGVLWTIATEFSGSLLVFAFLALFGGVRNRWFLYALLGIWAGRLHPHHFSFVIGMALSDAFVGLRISTIKLPLPISIALIGCSLAMFAHPVELPLFGNEEVWFALAATLILATTLTSTRLLPILTTRPLRFLGDLSFSIYLVHNTILLSAGCAAFVWGRNRLSLSYEWSAAMAAAATLVIVFPAAWLMSRYVDKPAIRLSKRCYERLFAAK